MENTEDHRNYKQEHIDILDSAGIEWPVKRTAMPWCQHLPQRELELLYFCHTQFPFDHEAGMEPEFIDLSYSSNYLLYFNVRTKPKGPWRKNRLPSLSMCGIYTMRQAMPSNSQSREPAPSTQQDVASVLGTVEQRTRSWMLDVSLRQTQVPELLATLGLDARHIPACARFHHKITRNVGQLIGNASSGFCVLPVLTALLATVTPDSQPIPAPLPQQVMDDQEEDDSDSH